MLLAAFLSAFQLEQPLRRDETIVAAPRSEAPATDTRADRVVVTAEELAATGERSLPRMLGKAAGVWIQETNLGGGSPLLLGLSGNQVLLLVDGVRMNDATTRNGVNQMLNGIEPATVERIEVLHGPRSVLYGSDALGGVVLVWTKNRAPRRDNDAPGGFAGAVEGQGDTAFEGGRAAVELSGAGPALGGLAVLGAHDWGGLHTAEGEVDHTGYDGETAFGAIDTYLGAGRSMRITTSITRDHDVPRTDRLVPGFGQTQPSNEEFDFTLQDRRRVVLAYRDQTDALVDDLELRLSYRGYDEERQIRATGSNTRRIEADRTDTLGLALDLRELLGDAHALTFGVDLDYDDVDSSRVDVDLTTGTPTANDGAFAPGSRFLSSGVFVQDEILGLEPYDVTAGLRYGFFVFGFDDPATGSEEGQFGALSGSLSVGRAVGSATRVVGTLARGFRAPNLSELARDASFFGGDELHNPDLEAETSLYAELACETGGNGWHGAVALFANEISDVVGSRQIDPGGPAPGDETYLRENIATLQIFGALLRGEHRLGNDGSPWSLAGNLEATRGRQESDFVDPNTGEKTFDGEPGQRIPPVHGWVGLRRALDLGWLAWAELGTAWALEQDRLSPQDLADPRIDPTGTDGWITLDLDVGGPLGSQAGSSWYLGVHNLLDEEYRVHGSGIDGPGLGLVVGARLAF